MGVGMCEWGADKNLCVPILHGGAGQGVQFNQKVYCLQTEAIMCWQDCWEKKKLQQEERKERSQILQEGEKESRNWKSLSERDNDI